MTCSVCGRSAMADSVFCSGCGSRVGVAEPPSMFAAQPAPAARSAAPAPDGLPVYTSRPAVPADSLRVYTSRARRGGVGALVALIALVVVGGVAFSIANVQSSVEGVFASTQEEFSSAAGLDQELAGPGDLRVTVSGWTPDVPAVEGQQLVGINAPRPGYRFSSATAFVCVGATAFAGPTDFSLRMADGTNEPALMTQRVLPGPLPSVTQNQCQRGSLVFEYPEGGQPVAVVFNGRDNAGFANPLAPVQLEWALPG